MEANPFTAEEDEGAGRSQIFGQKIVSRRRERPTRRYSGVGARRRCGQKHRQRSQRSKCISSETPPSETPLNPHNSSPGHSFSPDRAAWTTQIESSGSYSVATGISNAMRAVAYDYPHGVGNSNQGSHQVSTARLSPSKSNAISGRV